jgi:hypothetical protein
MFVKNLPNHLHFHSKSLQVKITNLVDSTNHEAALWTAAAGLEAFGNAPVAKGVTASSDVRLLEKLKAHRAHEFGGREVALAAV